MLTSHPFFIKQGCNPFREEPERCAGCPIGLSCAPHIVEKSKDAAMARRAAAVIRYRNPTLVGRLLRELDYALLECAYRGWWTEGLGL